MEKKKIESGFVPTIESLFQYAITTINAIPAFWVLFILFAGNFLTFIPDGNEENYLQLSKQFVNPGWIPNSFSLTEFPGTRLLYQYICGFFLQYISFETLTFLGRLLILIWYACALSALLKKFSFDNVYSLFLFQGLFFIQQATFGGENFLLGFEPKHIAYGFVLLALNTFVEKKYIETTVFILLASWFHILLGGWFFGAYIMYQFFNKEVSIKQVFIMGGLYSLLLAPFVYYLANEIILHSSKTNGIFSADWIYTYYRNPHHTAIFSSLDYFYDYHAKGVLWSFVIAVVSICIFPEVLVPKLFQLNKFVVVMSCILFVNVILAFFDKEGHFLKYYPFRLASMQLFLFYIIALSVVKEYFVKQHIFQSAAIVIVLFFFGMSVILNAYKMIRFIRNTNSSFYEMTTYINQHTPKDAVVYYADKSEDFTLSFTRKAQRDRFVVYKFVPAGTNKIYEWYDRIQIQQKSEKNIDSLLKARIKYKIDYVLTKDSIVNDGFVPVKKAGAYMLYKLQ